MSARCPLALSPSPGQYSHFSTHPLARHHARGRHWHAYHLHARPLVRTLLSRSASMRCDIIRPLSTDNKETYKGRIVVSSASLLSTGRYWPLAFTGFVQLQLSIFVRRSRRNTLNTAPCRYVLLALSTVPTSLDDHTISSSVVRSLECCCSPLTLSDLPEYEMENFLDRYVVCPR